MKPYSVYWIHHPEHTDMFTQGYVGVTNRYKRRLYEHTRQKKNYHFKNAINKYGWDTLVKKQLIFADENYCYDIEKKLRPSENIGWNLAIGGGKPPMFCGKLFQLGQASWNKGKKHSEKHLKNMSQARKGIPSWNKGKTGLQTAWNKGVSMAYRDNAHFTQQYTCPHCNKIGKGNAMLRHHMDNCKENQ